jgi:hypothetical protein
MVQLDMAPRGIALHLLGHAVDRGPAPAVAPPGVQLHPAR